MDTTVIRTAMQNALTRASQSGTPLVVYPDGSVLELGSVVTKMTQSRAGKVVTKTITCEQQVRKLRGVANIKETIPLFQEGSWTEYSNVFKLNSDSKSKQWLDEQLARAKNMWSFMKDDDSLPHPTKTINWRHGAVSMYEVGRTLYFRSVKTDILEACVYEGISLMGMTNLAGSSVTKRLDTVFNGIAVTHSVVKEPVKEIVAERSPELIADLKELKTYGGILRKIELTEKELADDIGDFRAHWIYGITSDDPGGTYHVCFKYMDAGFRAFLCSNIRQGMFDCNAPKPVAQPRVDLNAEAEAHNQAYLTRNEATKKHYNRIIRPTHKWVGMTKTQK